MDAGRQGSSGNGCASRAWKGVRVAAHFGRRDAHLRRGDFEFRPGHVVDRHETRGVTRLGGFERLAGVFEPVAGGLQNLIDSESREKGVTDFEGEPPFAFG